MSIPVKSAGAHAVFAVAAAALVSGTEGPATAGFGNKDFHLNRVLLKMPELSKLAAPNTLALAVSQAHTQLCALIRRVAHGGLPWGNPTFEAQRHRTLNVQPPTPHLLHLVETVHQQPRTNRR